MTYDAALYAALHRGNAGDLAYYRTRCVDAKSVLELGCGYGRVLAALQDVVAERWGIDTHEGLLALARAVTSAELINAPMQSFSLGRSFERIIIPYNGLYCLLSDGDVASCLAAARAHLAPEGRLLFDVYPYDGPPEPEVFEEAAEPMPIVQIESADQRFVVYESATFDPAGEVVEVTYRYVPEDEGEARVGRIAQRGMTEAQLSEQLAAAGFAVEDWRGGFRGEPFDDAAEQWVVSATASS